MAKIYEPQTGVYDKKTTPYDNLGGELDFLLVNEDGSFLLQEDAGKIILRGKPGYEPFNPYSKQGTPYSPLIA